MTKFEEVYNKLLASEGGYVNDPDDAGGETYKGVSRKANPTWLGWKIIDKIKTDNPNTFKKLLDKNNKLQELIKEFYKKNYWDIFNLDDIPSQRIAYQIFDTCVNCGKKRAIIIAEKACLMTATGKWSEELFENLKHYGSNK